VKSRLCRIGTLLGLCSTIKKISPEWSKASEITFKNGQFGLKMGVKNANDYSQPTLAETLKRS
jgi:hypothetical protein